MEGCMKRACFASGYSYGFIPGCADPVPMYPNSPHLRVAFGQRTFDAEGLEAPGRFFSRQIHWPGTSHSGVTIGRGYDMGMRTQLQIIRELTLAGMTRKDAVSLSSAAGLRGAAAEAFVRNRVGRAPIMTLEVQKALFERITTPEMTSDIKRIFDKPDIKARYGAVNWDALHPTVQELVFDLRYRGDYTPRVRERLQPALVASDYTMLLELMEDTEYWRASGVPQARIEERRMFARELLAEPIALAA